MGADRRNHLMCVAIVLLAFYALSEVLVAALSEMWSNGVPSEIFFLVLLVLAYFLGFANAKEKKETGKKGFEKTPKAPHQAKFAPPGAGHKAELPAYGLSQPGAGQSPWPKNPLGDGLANEARTPDSTPVQAEGDEAARRLAGFKRSDMWEHDMRVITQAKKEGMTHTAASYSAVMGACIRCNDVDMALELFGHMLKSGVTCDGHSVNVSSANKYFKLVAENLSEARMRDEGLQLLKVIQAFRLMPTNLIQNRLICAWRSKLPDHVLEVYVKMWEDGVPLSSTAYRCIMNAYERTEPERTLKLYGEMVERGVKLDRVAFNAALCAYSHLGMTAEAMTLFEEMPQHTLVPNGKTYGTLIRACTAANKAKEAVDLFEAMQQERMEPNRFAYHDAIHCCIKVKKIGKAITLYREMVQANVQPCDSTYLHLTKACQKRGWSEIADQIVADSARARSRAPGRPAESNVDHYAGLKEVAMDPDSE